MKRERERMRLMKRLLESSPSGNALTNLLLHLRSQRRASEMRCMESRSGKYVCGGRNHRFCVCGVRYISLCLCVWWGTTTFNPQGLLFLGFLRLYGFYPSMKQSFYLSILILGIKLFAYNII